MVCKLHASNNLYPDSTMYYKAGATDAPQEASLSQQLIRFALSSSHPRPTLHDTFDPPLKWRVKSVNPNRRGRRGRAAHSARPAPHRMMCACWYLVPEPTNAVGTASPPPRPTADPPPTMAEPHSPQLLLAMHAPTKRSTSPSARPSCHS